MNIDVSSKVTSTNNVSTTSSSKNQSDDSVKFSDELSSLSSKETKETEKTENTKKVENSEKQQEAEENTGDEELGDVIDGLEDAVAEINDKLNKPEKEDNKLINYDMNVQEQKDLQMFQMNSNMNFNSDGQPFANFMNSQDEQKLSSSAKDLEEETAILSTMNENIAMANKNRLLNENEVQRSQKVKTVANSEGIKKVDKQSNVTVETVVENGQADMTQATQKSSKVSKTLADLLAKSMKDNQPVRIDFDNNISVIIKISRDGKISADFLPTSQVAEAYLKENLPLLKQRFDENNIEYDELNHRERKQDNEKEDRKKEQKDE